MVGRNADRGLSLLQMLLEYAEGGRVFTSAEAVALGADLGLTPSHVYKLLSELTDRHILARPRGGLYVMHPPFGGVAPVRPILIAVHAVSPAAVCGETALAHWGLLAQAPLHEQAVATPARVQWAGLQREGRDRLWRVEGTTIRFRPIASGLMFGITSVRLDSETVVPIFDRERTLLDVLMQPSAGSAAWAVELLAEHRQALQLTRLEAYARCAGAARRLAAARAGDVAALAV